MLIIVESPAKAKTIDKIFKGKYKVKASVGHIRRISNKKKIGDKTFLVNGIDIDDGFKAIYEVDPDKSKVVSELKKLAKANDEILFATDSDREGEAISWHLAEVLGIKDKSKIKRLEFHEITKTALDKAIANPRKLDLNRVEAQQARQVLDKIVGYQLSPLLWSTMNNRNLSAGRVQSPALVIIALREKEIEAFVPVEYWELYGDFDENKTALKEKEQLLGEQKDEKPIVPDFKLSAIKGKKHKMLEDTSLVKDLRVRLALDNQFVVKDLSTKEVKSRPKPPFTTSTLQQAASSFLGMAPKRAMRVAQNLYEGVDIGGSPTALITYMRTDSTELSKEFLVSASNHVKKNYPESTYEGFRFYSSKSKNSQEAHEAIRPVNVSLTPFSLRGKISEPEWKLYDLIWRRTVASQMADSVSLLATLELENKDADVFAGSSSRMLKEGWKELFPSKNEYKALPDLKTGETVYLSLLDIYQKKTNPPSRYSAASLIKKLEELGIGRPSTYASIISTLLDRAYADEEGKAMKPTALGMKVAQILIDHFPKLTGSEMTAEMEDNLDKISRGEIEYLDLLDPFWKEFHKEVESKKEELYADKDKYRQGGEIMDDPQGRGNMILKIGRFGEYWQLESDPKVIYPKNFREIEATEKLAKEQYGDKVEKLVSPLSKNPLILRVAKKSLNTYVATDDYTPKTKEKAIPIKYLDDNNWTQKSVDEYYKREPKKGGKKRFKKKK